VIHTRKYHHVVHGRAPRDENAALVAHAHGAAVMHASLGNVTQMKYMVQDGSGLAGLVTIAEPAGDEHLTAVPQSSGDTLVLACAAAS
jgi:hypothetical protein